MKRLLLFYFVLYLGNSSQRYIGGQIISIDPSDDSYSLGTFTNLLSYSVLTTQSNWITDNYGLVARELLNNKICIGTVKSDILLIERNDQELTYYNTINYNGALTLGYSNGLEMISFNNDYVCLVISIQTNYSSYATTGSIFTYVIAKIQNNSINRINRGQTMMGFSPTYINFEIYHNQILMVIDYFLMDNSTIRSSGIILNPSVNGLSSKIVYFPMQYYVTYQYPLYYIEELNKFILFSRNSSSSTRYLYEMKVNRVQKTITPDGIRGIALNSASTGETVRVLVPSESVGGGNRLTLKQIQLSEEQNENIIDLVAFLKFAEKEAA